MNRLVRFFVLMFLRIAVVTTIVLWGVSRMFTLALTTSIGNTGFGVVSSIEGVSSAVMPGAPLPTTGRSIERRQKLSWHEYSGRSLPARQFLGFYYWQKNDWKFVQFGATYPAAVVSLILIYWFVSRVTRGNRRRERLKSKKAKLAETARNAKSSISR